MGEVTVTRSANTECDCEGAYVWSVTFLHLEGDIPKLVADDNSLTGAGAYMTVEVLQPSTVIDGNFTLSIRNYTTPPLSYKVNAENMAAALEAIGAGPVEVFRFGPDKQHGHVWWVTFMADYDNYDVPEMVADGSNLSGNGVAIGVHTHQQGEADLHGSFQLYFRDVGPTVPIPYNANVSTMIAALEDLISVDDVWITRSGPYADKGFTWTVTFVQVRHSTDEGCVTRVVATRAQRRVLTLYPSAVATAPQVRDGPSEQEPGANRPHEPRCEAVHLAPRRRARHPRHAHRHRRQGHGVVHHEQPRAPAMAPRGDGEGGHVSRVRVRAAAGG